MGYIPTGRPRGRPPLFERAMTGAERIARFRYFHKLMDSADGQRRNWWETAPPDMLGHQIAVSLFSFRYRKSDRNRWEAISAAVLKSLDELEREFC